MQNQSQSSTPAHPYSVSGVKSFRGREGYGFNANLHRDGRKVAFVIDEADGGMLRFEWHGKDAATRAADEQALADYCATLAPVDVDGHLLTMDPDSFLAVLVEDFENAKRVERSMRIALKKHVLFVVDGTLMQSKAPPSQELIDRLTANNPGAVVLNVLPPAEALARFRQHAVAA